MRRLWVVGLSLSLLTLVLAGCEDGTGAGPRGDVRGIVMVDGSTLVGVTVELTGPDTRTTTTDASGRYEFPDVPSGAYVVSVRQVPPDASFPATSRTAVVSGSQSVTVDFLGSFVRTGSIRGTVHAGPRALAGVTVLLRGTESRTTVTDPAGFFSFSGLRAGTYEVEITGVPESVSFPSIRTDVSLETGETHQVTFEGLPELTASVVIRSLARRTSAGASEPANPQELRGEVEVTLTVDRGDNTVESVTLLLGSEVVGQQFFAIGGSTGGADGVEPQPAPAAFDLTLVVNTAAFDPATGQVLFPNGERLLTASLATVEGGVEAWQSSIPVRLTNLDTVVGTVTPELGPVAGEDGEDWVGGALTLAIRPVLYDPSGAVGSITAEIRREGGGRQRVATVEGEAPFELVFPATGPPGSGNVAGYETLRGTTDQVRVVTARYRNGQVIPGVPVVLASGLRIDNVPPAAGPFRLPRQSLDGDCCLDNWVGSSFRFATGLQPEEDTGVGGVSVSIHAGPSHLSDQGLLALPPVERGDEVEPTSDNSGLSAVAWVRDALGNQQVRRLSPSEGNGLANALGGVFGVDRESPALAFGSAGVGDRAVNPPPGAVWMLSVGPGPSGIGPLPARTRIRVRAPSLQGEAACLFPTGAACEPAPDGLLRTLASGPEGYHTFEAYVLDRAGNRSSAVSRTVLRDQTPPSIQGIHVPATLTGGASSSFGAQVTDNVDLQSGWLALRFGNSGGEHQDVPFAAAEQVGIPFGGVLTSSVSLGWTFPLVVGVEAADAGPQADAPSGTLMRLEAVRVVARDAASNQAAATQSLSGVAGLDPRSFSVAERGESGGVLRWNLSADADQVCRAGSEDEECPTGVPGSVRLRAAARGQEGVFQAPFLQVHFYRVTGGALEWIGQSQQPSASGGSGPAGGAWTWDYFWTPAREVPPGAASLIAIGVDAEGNALRTGPLGSVRVVER